MVCIGRFSMIPNIPDFPTNKGPDAFVNGKVIRSMDYSAMDDSEANNFVKGKRVTVVGFQESALDIANECATANENINKISASTLSLLVTFLTPLRWAISKCVESYIKFFPLKKCVLVPEHRFSTDVTSCSISIAPKNFYDRVEEGSIVFKKSKGFGFYTNGLTFDDDATAPLETNIVILGTGYKGDVKLKNIFKSPTFQKYITDALNSTVPLYSYANLHTSEMMCRWLAHFLEEGFKLPSIKEMEKDMLEWETYMKRYSSRGGCIGTVHVWYNDQLFKDMGCNPKRKKGFFAELFEPYGPTDHANLTPGNN
ncbi:hypothetical protein MKX01_016301 [Papaver californicum]|nr:hypothetical protein MKX01_016301 [Papaver californicum]